MSDSPGSEDSPAFIALVQATAGATGAVFASFCLQPVEVAKTRIQLSHSGDVSTLGTITDIARSDGVPGLFRGTAAKCFETGSKNFVYFYIYDAINAIAKQQGPLTTFIKLVLGYVAGVGATVLTMPLEVLATKVQAETGDGLGTLGMVQRILEKEGALALFKGFWYNILLCINPAIQNTCFDKMKDWLLKVKARTAGKGGPSLTPFQAFALGAFAKAVATMVTYPLVRLKTIIQAGKEKDVQTSSSSRRTSNSKAPELIQSSSTSEMLSHMAVRKDKLPSLQSPIAKVIELYRGVGSALVKSVLQAALLYMTKDQVADFVRVLFKLTSRAFFRKDGRIKLGAMSGRPLAS